ncbi:hypothetical protein [Rhodospira trueperi]|uniref:Uncharacterized protein n=1 Tax=Rhodospira trueperi TaxID=69960 RepID=A0A1G7CT63_9PROT|nr:hypothetical protein [Rhodospira trueperi]SDE42479.1 hypothetical protein SAMN05421720_106210 [Rhodospira trueperi]
MIVTVGDSQAMETLVLLALAFLVGVQAFPLSPTWRRRGLIVGAVCLGGAILLAVAAYLW